MLGTDTAIPQDVLEHLHVGMSVTLTMDTGDRYLAKIVGWKTGDSIILEIPKAYEASVGDLFTMKRSPFQAQRETVVRFVSDGIAYGFRQTIAEIVYMNHEPHCLIGWPHTYERVQVRRHHRVAMNTECAISRGLSDDFLAATLHDVSESGAAILNDSSIPVGTNIRISTPRHARLRLESVEAVVRGVVHLGYQHKIGCEFKNLKPQTHAALKTLATVDVESKAGHSQISHHFVIGLSPHGSSAELFDQLNLTHSQFVQCSTLAECVHLIYALDVVAILIDVTASDWRIEDLCRLIRSSDSAKKIRIVAYGRGAQFDPKAVDLSLGTGEIGSDVSGIVDSYVGEVIAARKA